MGKKKDGHGRLSPTVPFHGKCENCQDCQIPIRIMLDEEIGLETLERFVECEGHRWNFSIGLMANHVVPVKPYIIRACSSHNYHHYHIHSFKYPLRSELATNPRVLTSKEEAHDAYLQSLTVINKDPYGRWEKWIRGN